MKCPLLLAPSMCEDEVLALLTTPARLHFVPHALAPLADLPVLEVVSTSHILTDLTLGRAAAVHDYLAKEQG